jgi:hypothetical protein
MAAMRFSLASDIVELVVLTGDEIFLQTLRAAVGGSRGLWYVPSSDKVSDLLVAGGIGILVLDAEALNETANLFIAEIKRQFPDLIVVVAGSREAETALARAISDGTVYRFIHKPMSPGRARLFADAAVRKYAEQRKRDDGAVAATTTNHGLLIGAACAALCVVLGVIWLLRHAAHDARDSPQAVKAPAPPPPATPLLARAADALAAHRFRSAHTSASASPWAAKRLNCARSPWPAIRGQARQSALPMPGHPTHRRHACVSARFYRSAPGSACHACRTDPWYAVWDRAHSGCRAQPEIAACIRG